MRVYCVGSHKKIGSNPEKVQGVLLLPEMLGRGIWDRRQLGGSSTDTTRKFQSILERDARELHYRDALDALLGLRVNEENKAVISLPWCEDVELLTTAHRVWLNIYYADVCVASYSHKGNHALYSFLDCWDEMPASSVVWQGRFSKEMADFWSDKLDKDKASRAAAQRDLRQVAEAIS